MAGAFAHPWMRLAPKAREPAFLLLTFILFAMGAAMLSSPSIGRLECFRAGRRSPCLARRLQLSALAQHRLEEGVRPLQNVAALGLVAIMVAAQPQMAMAAPSTGPTQGDLLTELLEKNSRGVKILKAPKKAEAAVRAPFVPESKLAAQQKKPAAKPVSKPAPAAKKPAPVKKVENALSSSVLKFREPVKAGAAGIVPEGISLPSPKAVQQAAVQAGKEAKQAVESAISSVTPAAAPKAAKDIGVKLRNPLAPITAAAAAAAGGIFGAGGAPSVPSAAPSLGVTLPAGVSQDSAEAVGVAAAELVGAVIASALVGGITAKVPSKKELKV